MTWTHPSCPGVGLVVVMVLGYIAVVRTQTPASVCDESQVEPYYCGFLRQDECYYNHEECCKTCSKYHTSIQGCDFGDKASVCTGDLCSYPGNEEVCCFSCRAVSTVFPEELSTSAMLGHVTTVVITPNTTLEATTSAGSKGNVQTVVAFMLMVVAILYTGALWI